MQAKHIGIGCAVLHFLIAMFSLAQFASLELNFQIPFGSWHDQTSLRFFMDFAFFLTISLATGWSAFKADRRVQKLFQLLSVTVLVLYFLN
ncbi:MAG TPA: hypothetical protein PLV21_12845 [Cyclobacteriaceae bacterium]|nr:hypothetical protein [Cyclobacteriaceae bacterium]HRJ82770.1 hypothetical protein [Cyclobacteriaceae bacterium]